tara:strand:- start:2792 stop:2956 length:165 start_codon:yes stop_codon:yes gene_type:complete
MTENEATKLIEDECHSSDREGNGCRLDAILDQYFREAGANTLADAIESVPAWRA